MMKNKIFAIYKTILFVILALYAGIANANEYYNGHQYFTWNDADHRGLVMSNADGGNVYLHCKKEDVGSNGEMIYRFYCDEACTVECIGLGYEHDTSNWTNKIAWRPVVDVPITSLSPAFSINDHQKEYNSPHDITQLIYMMSDAAVKLITLDGAKIDIGKVRFHICMHNTYELEYTEFTATYAEGQDVYVVNLNTGFNGITITRHESMMGKGMPLISINNNHFNDKAINFQPGDQFYIDNNTTSNDDVAVLINHYALFMDSWARITNSKSGGTKDQYYGIGVRLEANGSGIHAPAIELGDESQSSLGTVLGTAKISKCAIGVDAQAGVVRLKMSKETDPVRLDDNKIAINMVHGVTLGKWANDISSFNSENIIITLENPSEWHSGDIVFTSGQSRRPDHHKTPLYREDISKLKFASASDLSKIYDIVFDNSLQVTGGDPNTNYLYPLFLLSKKVIYNTRTQKWYPNLYMAVNDNNSGDNYKLQDNDVLVYYGDVIEQNSVVINKNVTIRSAKKGTSDELADLMSQTGEEIATAGYTSTWVKAEANAENFITVAAGKTLTLGGDNSGPFCMNINGKGRGVLVNGTVSAKSNFTLKNSLSGNGGGFYVPNGGTLNVEGASITDNKAKNGGAIYVAQGGVANVSSGTLENNAIIDNGLGAAIFQDGTMNLKGNPTFGENDAVYLPKNKVITKTGEIDATVLVPVSVENENDGRDILVSADEAGKVKDTDQARISLHLSDDYTYRVVYNATGNDNTAASPKDVVELCMNRADIYIEKTGLKKGESAVFTVKKKGTDNILFTVSITADAEGKGFKKIKEQPVGEYTITETSWSWGYSPVEPQTKLVCDNTKDAIKLATVFSFTNTPKSGTPTHSEAEKTNKFPK